MGRDLDDLIGRSIARLEAGDDPDLVAEALRAALGPEFEHGIRRRAEGIGRGQLVPDEGEPSLGGATLHPSPDSEPVSPSSRYTVGETLGVGGMGEVVAAHDERLRRVVAIKRIRGKADGETLMRFLHEAQITGQLGHPNIMPIYDLGTGPDGTAYFTMKKVDGSSISQIIRAGGSWSLHARLEVFAKVCDAIAFAHSRGVLHRDLKPANIMVGEFGEVLVLDWGVAKVRGRAEPSVSAVASDWSEAGAEGTVDGAIVGTPAYMSPEQAAGETDCVDERSDVYALGAVLYVLLTDSAPFLGRPHEILDDVREGRLEAPSRRAPDRGIPRELEAMTLKAMAFEPEHRYASAAELRGDVQAYLEGRTLASVQYTRGERALKWARRHRVAVSTAVVMGGAAAILGVLGVAGHVEASPAPGTAPSSRPSGPWPPSTTPRSVRSTPRSPLRSPARAEGASWRPSKGSMPPLRPTGRVASRPAGPRSPGPRWWPRPACPWPPSTSTSP